MFDSNDVELFMIFNAMPGLISKSEAVAWRKLTVECPFICLAKQEGHISGTWGVRQISSKEGAAGL